MDISKKQLYHLETNKGLINDPNGLVYYKGIYYVFFQWNRLKKDHSYKEWGLFVSKDMINWEFKDSAIIPDQYYDSHGVYSGSSCIVGEELYLYYTGNSKTNGQRKSYQCLVTSKDGQKFKKRGPILNTPKQYTEHFRDPKVIKVSKDNYYMLIGAQKINGKGAIAIASSKNGKHWEYKRQIAESLIYEMIECPDLFKINNKDIILYGLQSRNNERDVVLSSISVYKFIEFDSENGVITHNKDLDTNFKYIDYGFDFYAPQTFEDDRGRRIMYGWMSRMESDQEEAFSRNEENIHCLTLPRELSIINNQLYQKPVNELYELLGEEIKDIYNNGGTISLYPKHRAYHFYISISAIDEELNINFNQNECGLNFNKNKKNLGLWRYNWISQSIESKQSQLINIHSIEVWMDQSSIEIFINNGEKVLSSRIYPLHKKASILIDGLNDLYKIQLNEMNMGGKNNE